MVRCFEYGDENIGATEAAECLCSQLLTERRLQAFNLDGHRLVMG